MHGLPPRLRLIARIVFCLVAIFVFALPLAARAGGAGGSDSGGSSWDSGSDWGDDSDGDARFIIYLIIMLVDLIGPIPTAILVAVLVIIWRLTAKYRAKRTNGVQQTVRKSSGQSDDSRGLVKLEKEDPQFTRASFEERVRTAFVAIQKAWEAQDLKPVRKYISDGVYQRFNTQFEMMQLLAQTNVLANITVHTVWLPRVQADADFDTIDVGIRATISDRFICKSNPSLNSGGTETFTEYWSFIRKRGVKTEHDLYSSNNCPACSAPLPDDLGERGQCPYCSALVNSGEYDWVLSEITQAEDFGAEYALRARLGASRTGYEVLQNFPDSPVQRVEDLASNAYMQIQSAIVRRKPEAMRRFTSSAFFEKAKSRIGSGDDRVVYNRLYLNHVMFLGQVYDEIGESGGGKGGSRANGQHGDASGDATDTIKVAIALRATYQRARVSGGTSRLLDSTILTRDEILIFQRRAAGTGTAKGSLLMHQCASCGGPIKDSLDLTCPYCGSQYNSGDHDWVVADLVPREQFRMPKQKTAAVRASDFESVYDVRDYVLLNVIVILAADGHFTPEERNFADQVAKQLGYKPEGLEPIFAQASAGKLGIRMPHEAAKRAKIFKMMEKAAAIDGHIDPREQQILADVKRSYAM